MSERRLVLCKECEAHFDAPSESVFDNGAPERGVELRCPVCCVRESYDMADVMVVLDLGEPRRPERNVTVPTTL